MAEKPAEFRLSPEAEGDLEQIWLHTFDVWGLEQANRYADELVEAFARLARDPFIGVACAEIREGYRRSGSAQHMIYYRLTSYGIAVIRVLHGRMNPPNHL